MSNDREDMAGLDAFEVVGQLVVYAFIAVAIWFAGFLYGQTTVKPTECPKIVPEKCLKASDIRRATYKYLRCES